MTILTPFLVAFGVTLAVTPLVRAFARARGFIAAPSVERWHEKPTALLGGIAVFAGVMAGSAGGVSLSLHFVGLGRPEIGIVFAATLMFFVGLADDWLKLRPATKLIFQAVAAAVVISCGVLYPLSPWTVINVLATFFWFIGLTNALNLLDNMDGVAVGVGGIAAVFLAVTFINGASPVLAALCLALAGASLGFLPYNFHRASIFMGDSGSLLIGALLAGLVAAYPHSASASIISVLFVPALIVIIPILDTVLVTLARTLAGRPISVGGRDHAAHRLVAMGLSERQVALLLYACAVAGGIVALVLSNAPQRFGVLVNAIFLVGLLIGAVYLGRMHSYTPSAAPAGRITLMITDLLHKKRALEVLVDLVLFAVAYQAAYLLRWDGDPPPEQLDLFEGTLAIAVVAKALAFGAFGVYRGTWRQLSISDAHRIARATVVGSLLTVTALVIFFQEAEFARSVLVLDGLLAGLLAVGTRASFRTLDHLRNSLGQGGTPTLIYGAGKAGELAVREMISNIELGLRPVGFIDDDPVKRGRLVCGLPVLGGVNDLNSILRDKGAEAIVLSSRKLTGTHVLNVRRYCEEFEVNLVQLNVEFLSIPPWRTASSADTGITETKRPLYTSQESDFTMTGVPPR